MFGYIGGIHAQCSTNFTIISAAAISLFICRPMHSIFNHLLAGLCIGDLLFLLCNLLVVPIAFGQENSVLNLLYLVAECGSHISLSVSIFLTVSITIERFKVIIFNIIVRFLSYISRLCASLLATPTIPGDMARPSLSPPTCCPPWSWPSFSTSPGYWRYLL